jgi:group I intron endonuclease
MRGFIYLIRNRINGKVYVGCTTVGIEKRWRKHVAAARRESLTTPLMVAIREFGAAAFSVETLLVLEETNRADLGVAEMRHIRMYESKQPKGYNVSIGGSGVVFDDPALNKKRSDASKRAASSPENRARSKERALALAQTVEWREAQLAGVRKNAEDPEWLAATAARNRHLATQDDWKKALEAGVSRRNQDPSWVSGHQKLLAELHSNPKYIEARKAGARRMASNPLWQEAHREMIRKRSSNPVWKAGQERARQAANDARARKALERDTLCSPAERRKREQRRAADRRCKARKRNRVSG